MKSNVILNRIGCCLIIILSVFNSNAQPDYLSKEFDYCNVLYSVIPYDSGYFLQDNSFNTFYKVNFEGDTIKTLHFQGRLPGTYSCFMGKANNENMIIAGQYKNLYTGQSMLFISKINMNLDTLWVKYYPELLAGGPILINDTISVIKIDAQSNIHIQIFSPCGELIEHRIHPKYPGSNGMTIYSIAVVNAKKYAIAVLSAYYNSWLQDYYYKPMICVSDTNDYNYFESGFEYIYGSGASQSFIFYDKASNRIKHFYHFTQLWNAVTLYEHSLSGQLISSKGIYNDHGDTTGEIWDPNGIAMLGNGSFVIAGSWEKIYQNISGGFLMRCGPQGEWNWFRKYHEEQTSGYNGVLYSCTETDNHFLACAGKSNYAWLLVVDSLGCEAPGVCWVGEEEISALPQENLFEVFPNPAGEEVWVRSAAPLAGLTIYAMNGQKMPMAALSGENPMRIDTRAWPAGLYVVRATLQNGRVVTQKVMKR
jgi:hypothetical protein